MNNYNLDDYQAIIVAVGHEKYRNLEISMKRKKYSILNLFYRSMGDRRFSPSRSKYKGITREDIF